MKLKNEIHQLEKCRVFFSYNLIKSNGFYNHFHIKHQKWFSRAHVGKKYAQTDHMEIR